MTHGENEQDIKPIVAMAKQEQLWGPMFKSIPDKFRAEVSSCLTQQELKVNDTDLDTEKCATAGHITCDK